MIGVRMWSLIGDAAFQQKKKKKIGDAAKYISLKDKWL